jgi:hypothetical protein
MMHEGMSTRHHLAQLAAIMAMLGAERSPNLEAREDPITRGDDRPGYYPDRRLSAKVQTEREAAAVVLQEERRRRKAENFAKRQPKGTKP